MDTVTLKGLNFSKSVNYTELYTNSCKHPLATETMHSNSELHFESAPKVKLDQTLLIPWEDSIREIKIGTYWYLIVNVKTNKNLVLMTSKRIKKCY